MKKSSISIFAGLHLLLLSFSLYAGNSDSLNSKIQNGYEVHFNAFSTNFLTKKVSKQYQIGRSKTRGMLNISIQKLQKGKVGTPVEANITLKSQNLYGQSKEIKLRKISENDGAIYYIGTFTVSSRETIIFKAQVVPEGSNKAIEIKFNQEFFTD